MKMLPPTDSTISGETTNAACFIVRFRPYYMVNAYRAPHHRVKKIPTSESARRMDR
jgi:hypothetical protein